MIGKQYKNRRISRIFWGNAPILCSFHAIRIERDANVCTTKKAKSKPLGKESLEIFSIFALVNLSKNEFVYNSKE